MICAPESERSTRRTTSAPKCTLGLVSKVCRGHRREPPGSRDDSGRAEYGSLTACRFRGFSPAKICRMRLSIQVQFYNIVVRRTPTLSLALYRNETRLKAN